MKNRIRETINREDFQFMDGRATGENHVMKLKDRFGLKVYFFLWEGGNFFLSKFFF
jgi:hypothetical protein